MIIEGLQFLQFLLVTMATPFLAIAMGLVLVGISASEDFEQFRSRFNGVLSPILKTDWEQLPYRALSSLVATFNKYLDYWFRQSENNILVDGLFILIILIGIPIGSVINLLMGGTEFLFILVVSVVTAFVTLAVTGETLRLRSISPALSIFIFLALFLFLPGYVFYSSTGYILGLDVGHAAIGCLLIAPFLYLTCQSLSLGIVQLFNTQKDHHTGKHTEQLITSFLAVLPLSYILVFAAFLAGQFATPEQPLPINWPTLLSSMISFGFCVSLTYSLLSWAANSRNFLPNLVAIFLSGIICILSGFAITWFGFSPETVTVMGLFYMMLGMSPEGDIIRLGPLFWVTHITSVPLVIIIGSTILTYLTRAAFCFVAKENFSDIDAPRIVCRAGGVSLGTFGFILVGIALTIQ